MKINSNSYASCSNSADRNKNQNKKINFGNGTNPVVGIATFIENNGFLGEFLTVDGVGMITPRTVQGYTRNAKELGHPNYKAGHEELVRELLSGPAFFFVPLTVLTASSLIKGKAAKVTTQTIDSFKNIMKDASKNISDIKNTKQVNKEFLNSLFDKAFKGYNEAPDKITKIKETFNKILDKSSTKKQKKQAKKELKETMAILNKSNGKFFDDNLSIKIGEITSKKGTTDHTVQVTELINDIPNYLENFNKKAQKTSSTPEKFIESFNETAKMVRKTTNIIAVAALSAFLSIIPKLYQVDKKFPGVEGLDTSNAPQKGKNNLFQKHSSKAKGGQIANK